MKFKQGDYVRIIEREQTPADIKNGAYYPHFAGLAGTVDRIYENEICLNVDLGTLPQDILKRHLTIQNSIKRKWLNNLSNEMRNRLTGEDKKFNLSYTLLAQEADIEKATPSEKPVVLPEIEAADEDDIIEQKITPVTSEDLEAAELEFLKERAQVVKNN